MKFYSINYKCWWEILCDDVINVTLHHLPPQETLHNHYSETVSDVKQSLLVSQPPQFEGQNTLADIMSTMKASLVGKLKLVLVNVMEFISADITFANKPYFR